MPLCTALSGVAVALAVTEAGVLPLSSLACNSAIAVAVSIAEDAITSVVVVVSAAGNDDHRLDFPAAAAGVVVAAASLLLSAHAIMQAISSCHAPKKQAFTYCLCVHNNSVNCILLRACLHENTLYEREYVSMLLVYIYTCRIR
jgi:hypothetical protein